MHLLDADFRPHPDYEVVPLDRLDSAESTALGGLRDDADCFGILRPRPGSGLRIKSICRQTARLLGDLTTAARLPSFLSELPRAQVEKQLIDLVLGDVVQILLDGLFVSGASAFGRLAPSREIAPELGRLARMSIEAVRYGQRLPMDDPLRLSAQIYFYNRQPVTAHWSRRIPDEAAHARFLGLAKGGRCLRLLDALGRRVADAPQLMGWHMWSARTGPDGRRERPFAFKMYVSPLTAELPEVLPKVLEAFVELRVQRVKIGAGVSGLMRPDKIVAYFDDFALLEATAERLLVELRGVGAQGVPFTAELGGQGFVSWGMDPHETGKLRWQESTSWRLWITNRLAAAILDARRSQTGEIEGWRYALDRLARDGVDTQTWTPTAEYDRQIASPENITAS